MMTDKNKPRQYSYALPSQIIDNFELDNFREIDNHEIDIYTKAGEKYYAKIRARSMSDYQYQRRVVCAANRLVGYASQLPCIVCSARHFDDVMRFQIEEVECAGGTIEYSDWEQGFIDQHGVFMTREEAWEVAVAANQIIRRVGGDNGCLCSENLY